MTDTLATEAEKHLAVIKQTLADVGETNEPRGAYTLAVASLKCLNIQSNVRLARQVDTLNTAVARLNRRIKGL